MTADELKQEIETAFRSARRPADYQIVGHSCWECDRVADDFRGRDWRDVPFPTLFYHRDSLPLFTPVAFRYFLPAYVLAAVFHYEQSDVIPHSIAFRLIPPSRSEGESEEEHKSMSDYYHQRVDEFTPAQRKALISYLRFLKQEHRTDFPGDDLDGVGDGEDLDKAIEAMERL